MTTRAKVTGDHLAGMGDEILRELRPDAIRAVDEAADVLEEEIRDQLQATGHGVPSAPGQQPAMREGDLLRSVRREPARVRDNPHGFTVSSAVLVDDPGAARVEFGARDVRGIETQPHPFYLRAVKVVTPKLRAIWDKVGRR